MADASITSDIPVARLPAVCGGSPRLSQPRYVGTPTIPDRSVLHARLDKMLDARRLTNDGPFVRDLERRLSVLNGGVEVVAVCNATIGMQLLMRALDVTGEVIIPSFTFIATAHACLWERLDPVFVDVDPVTHVIDPCHVAELLSERTAAIVGVHLWGRMCPVDELERLAHMHGVPLVFDAAHAIGCTYRGIPMGRLGTASVVSLHATKFIQSLEGGAILTPDRQLADRLRLMRNFGFAGYDHVTSIGTNAKLDEFSAVMALGSLEGIDALINRNRVNRDAYRTALAGIPGITLYEYDETEANNYQYLIVLVDPEISPFTRDEIVEILHAENVIARRYFSPGCHRSPPYVKMPATVRSPLPVTDRLAEVLLAMPTGSGVDVEDILVIGEILRGAVQHRREVCDVLRERRLARSGS